jgi:hypothetical protein
LFDAGHEVIDSDFAADYRRKKPEPAFGIDAGIRGNADLQGQIVLLLESRGGWGCLVVGQSGRGIYWES